MCFNLDLEHMKVRANGIELEVEDTGPGAGPEPRPAVMLIMGLGMQLIAWPEPLVSALVAAGYRVIRHDNRDIGLSQHFDASGKPSLLMAMLRRRLGLKQSPAYTVHDMAADALGVLDALGVQKAHVVGASMGGMIAQRLALAAPERVSTLTSIMSSSGARGLPRSHPDVVRLGLRRPRSLTREAQVEYSVRVFRRIGSPGFPTDEAETRARQTAQFDRSFHPVGMQRQLAAVLADLTRAEELAKLRVPTLVVHGKDDPLVPWPCGEDTARRIPGAKWVLIEGMGHDLAPGVQQRLLELLLPHFAQK